MSGNFNFIEVFGELIVNSDGLIELICFYNFFITTFKSDFNKLRFNE